MASRNGGAAPCARVKGPFEAPAFGTPTNKIANFGD
jgi:hypothetical protein